MSNRIIRSKKIKKSKNPNMKRRARSRNKIRQNLPLSLLSITADNKQIPYIIMRRYIKNEHQRIFSRIKNRGFKLIGMCSMPDFPRGRKEAKETNIWLHCYHDPDDYIPQNTYKKLISESDFIDADPVCPKKEPKIDHKKSTDIIYICYDRSNQKRWKNFDFFAKVMPQITEDLNLTCGIIGMKKLPKELKGNEDKIKCLGVKGVKDVKETLSNSQMIFVPSVKDASPRVLGEALSVNTPALVNQNIQGGWKYINETTGDFFQDENDVIEKVNQVIIKKNNNISEWWQQYYGSENASNELRDFLQNIGMKVPDGKINFHNDIML